MEYYRVLPLRTYPAARKKYPTRERRRNLEELLSSCAHKAKRDFKYRKDEIFKRMKVTTFVQLMIQVAEINAVENSAYDDLPTEADGCGDGFVRPDTADSELQKLDDNPEKTNGHDGEAASPSQDVPDGDCAATPAKLDTSRSTLLSVARGVGELDLDKPASPKTSVDESRPYLLLDLREKDEFDACHLITAVNYPSAMLSRAVNYESKEMLTYKNQAGKIIVVYDEEERIGPKAASTLVDRGYDNLFFLSGGLKVAYKLFPEGLITGTIPAAISPPKKKAVPVPASQSEFTSSDLNKLTVQLDDVLDDRSIGSRLSKTSSSSRTHSQMSTKSTASSVSGRISGRAPFK